MEIFKGIKQLKGNPVEIPDCSRLGLPEFFKQMGFKVGVEIGVYKGAFLEKFCEAGLEIYGIDPWRPYVDFDIEQDNRKSRQEFLYQHTKKALAPYDNVTLIRKLSMEALADFEDGSLDFVYIDGNHKLKYVTEDICEWSKKVKKGGVISGHDYVHPKRVEGRFNNLHAKFAVDAYVQAYRIKNWYLLGRQDPTVAGERRDRFRSWMWINN